MALVPNVNGHDPVAIEAAIEAAKQAGGKPSMICCKTVIGMGSPNKADTHEVHGAALGDVEIAATRPHIGWHHLPFEIPGEVYATWDARPKGQRLEDEWNRTFAEYSENIPPRPPSLPAAWRATCRMAGATT